MFSYCCLAQIWGKTVVASTNICWGFCGKCFFFSSLPARIFLLTVLASLQRLFSWTTTLCTIKVSTFSSNLLACKDNYLELEEVIRLCMHWLTSSDLKMEQSRQVSNPTVSMWTPNYALISQSTLNPCIWTTLCCHEEQSDFRSSSSPCTMEESRFQNCFPGAISMIKNNSTT